MLHGTLILIIFCSCCSVVICLSPSCSLIMLELLMASCVCKHPLMILQLILNQQLMPVWLKSVQRVVITATQLCLFIYRVQFLLLLALFMMRCIPWVVSRYNVCIIILYAHSICCQHQPCLHQNCNLFCHIATYIRSRNIHVSNGQCELVFFFQPCLSSTVVLVARTCYCQLHRCLLALQQCL